MANRVRAISNLRSSSEYSPGDFVITTDSIFLDFELQPLNGTTYDTQVQVERLHEVASIYLRTEIWFS